MSSIAASLGSAPVRVVGRTAAAAGVDDASAEEATSGEGEDAAGDAAADAVAAVDSAAAVAAGVSAAAAAPGAAFVLVGCVCVCGCMNLVRSIFAGNLMASASFFLLSVEKSNSKRPNCTTNSGGNSRK
jgi:hypothetical protein